MILFSILLLTTVYLSDTAAQEAGSKKAGAASGDITSSVEYDEYSKVMQSGPSYHYDQGYKDLTFEEVYGQKVEPPAIDLGVDLSKRSLSELSLLRNTVYARHGFLFMDSVTRGYFNQFAWYQPVFWEANFKIELSKEEESFIKRVKAEEAKRLKDNTVTRDGVMLGNTANIVNREMFKTMPDKAFSLLREKRSVTRNSRLLRVSGAGQSIYISTSRAGGTALTIWPWSLMSIHIMTSLEGDPS